MPKFNANLTMLFNEVEFLDRFRAAKDAGFRAVEYLFPYAYRKEDLVERLQGHGLTQVLHNLPAGNWAGGERGIACHPDRVGEFQDGVGTAIDYAHALGCTQLNCLVGIAPAGCDAARVHDTLVRNLQFAAAALGRARIALLIEACNTRDIPGFYLNRSQQAIDLIDAVGSDNLFSVRIYHMQVWRGTRATIERPAADPPPPAGRQPGRHEPGTGEINYPFLFEFIDRLGYTGWIGCEYRPAAATSAGLGWIEPYL